MTKLRTGFFPDIPEDAYHADRDTLSSTGARHVLRSPAHYQAYLNEPRTETPALKLGKALHALALEGREVSKTATGKNQVEARYGGTFPPAEGPPVFGENARFLALFGCGTRGFCARFGTEKAATAETHPG